MTQVTARASEPMGDDGSPGSGVRQVRNGRRSRLAQAVNGSIVALALVLLIAFFAITSSHFITADNVQTIFDDVAVVAVLTIGQQLVITTAGIDLSLGPNAALCGMIAGLMMVHGMWVGVILAVALGTGVGLLNGFLVAFTRIPPFIVTLGTNGICAGGALLATSGVGIYTFPQTFLSFGTGSWGVFPFLIIVTIVLAVLGQLLLGTTRFGRSVYAIGSNFRAAQLSGLPVRRNLILVYTIAGFLAGVAGLLLTAYVAGAIPTAGDSYVLPPIAAVVIGGGSLFGGEGTVWGAMLGALLMSVLSDGTQLLGVSTYTEEVILGVVVIGAVFIDSFRKRVAV